MKTHGQGSRKFKFGFLLVKLHQGEVLCEFFSLMWHPHIVMAELITNASKLTYYGALCEESLLYQIYTKILIEFHSTISSEWFMLVTQHNLSKHLICPKRSKYLRKTILSKWEYKAHCLSYGFCFCMEIMATLIRENIKWGGLQSMALVYYCHHCKQGSMQADMVLGRELRVLPSWLTGNIYETSNPTSIVTHFLQEDWDMPPNSATSFEGYFLSSYTHNYWIAKALCHAM